MEQLAALLALIVGVVGTTLVGPVLAGLFLSARKNRRKRQRRSPISIDLLRSPGHTVREQLEEVTHDANGNLLVLSTMPVVMLAFFLAQSLYVGLPQMRGFVWFYVVLVLVVIASLVLKLVRLGEKIDNLRAGFDAELAVGQELDKLMRQGAVVFHDFPAEQFNLDHIVIAPQGVFAVETKGYTKPGDLKGREGSTVTYDGTSLKFPMWTVREPLEQAERQADWLARWLTSAVGEKTSVIPVVALPGWFVKLTGWGPVRVFNGKLLSGLLEGRVTAPLSAQDVQRISHQVEQRCRTVAPKYGQSDKLRKN